MDLTYRFCAALHMAGQRGGLGQPFTAGLRNARIYSPSIENTLKTSPARWAANCTIRRRRAVRLSCAGDWCSSKRPACAQPQLAQLGSSGGFMIG